MHVLVIFIDGDKLPYTEDALIAIVIMQRRMRGGDISWAPLLGGEEESLLAEI